MTLSKRDSLLNSPDTMEKVTCSLDVKIIMICMLQSKKKEGVGELFVLVSDTGEIAVLLWKMLPLTVQLTRRFLLSTIILVI